MLLNNVFSIFCHLCQLCWEAAEASHHPQMRTQAASDATSVGWKRLLVCDGVTHVSHVSWSSAVWCILWWISHLFVLFDREGAILHLCNTDCDELEERVFKVWMILSYTQLNINIPITFPSLSLLVLGWACPVAGLVRQASGRCWPQSKVTCLNLVNLRVETRGRGWDNLLSWSPIILDTETSL